MASRRARWLAGALAAAALAALAHWLASTYVAALAAERFLVPWPMYRVALAVLNAADKLFYALAPPSAVLMRHASAYAVSGALYSATRLGVADALAAAGGAASTGELAERCGVAAASREAFAVLLVALRQMSVVHYDPARELWCLNAVSERLRTDASAGEASMAPIVLLLGSEHYLAMHALSDGLRAGTSAYAQAFAHQPNFWTLLQRDADAGRRFDAAMRSVELSEHAALLADYALGTHAVLIDVAGGRGGLLRDALARWPAVRGVLADRPDVVARAQADWDADSAARMRFVAVDMLAAQPALPASDEPSAAFVLKHVLHDWDDESCVAILRAVAEAMRAPQRLLIVARLLEPHADFVPSHGTALSSLIMSAMYSHARERSLAEHEVLLARAGLRVERVASTRSAVSVIVARLAPAQSAGA